LTLILRPWTVLGDDPDLLAASDPGDVARDRQATLEVAVVSLALDQARVHELVDVAANFYDGDLQRHADLRRGKTHARRGAHGLSQVVEQAV
jgi:hypothetical protein